MYGPEAQSVFATFAATFLVKVTCVVLSTARY